MTSTCVSCSASFRVLDEDKNFLDEVSNIHGKKYPIPLPERCPPCRLQRRLLFRNERKLYNTKSALDGSEHISTFAPDSKYKSCTQEQWNSDEYDPFKYGMDVDLDRPFFDQLAELNAAVPHPALTNTNVENSEYTNFALNQKNCYLIFGGGDNEDCMHGKFVIYCKDTVDCLSLYSSELCYEAIASQDCYNCKYILNCQNCSDCLLLEDCSSCKNCVGCFGLRNKQYCFFNEQLDEEQYQKILADHVMLTPSKLQELQEKFESMKSKLPHVASHIYASEHCTGDMIFNSKNCINCFDIKNCEDCRYTAFTPNGVSSQDACFSAPMGVERCYETISTAGGNNCLGCFMCWNVSDLYYSLHCRSSANLFGCCGLKNSKFCILNKQYSEDEYYDLMHKLLEAMVARGEWGRFLPPALSHYAYNETIANEYFPLTKEQVLADGFAWREEEGETPDVEKVIPGDKLPENIADIPDDVLNWAITCVKTGRPFRITKPELEFYRRNKLPVPCIHPDERHLMRLAKKNPYRLWQEKCSKCSKDVYTNTPPGHKHILYCEECYLAEVY